MKVAFFVDLFPKFMRRYVFFALSFYLKELKFVRLLNSTISKYVTRLPSYVNRTAKHVAPIFEERLRMKAEHDKDSPDREVNSRLRIIPAPNTLTILQNNYISWLLDAVDGNKRTTRDLMLRVLAINFGAIHTSTTVKLLSTVTPLSENQTDIFSGFYACIVRPSG